MAISFVCPVCGSKVNQAICNTCGYTHFLFPMEIPPQVKRFEDLRVSIMKRIRKKMEGGDEKIEISDHSLSNHVVGTLMIRNMMTEATYAYPIKEGRNVYGGQSSKSPTFTYIDPLALGISIPKTIFCIEASNDGLVLIPHKDFVLSYNRYIIKRNMPIENEDYFFYSNLLSFHAVKF